MDRNAEKPSTIVRFILIINPISKTELPEQQKTFFLVIFSWTLANWQKMRIRLFRWNEFNYESETWIYYAELEDIVKWDS